MTIHVYSKVLNFVMFVKTIIDITGFYFANMLICDYSMETLMICYITKHDDKIKAII